MASVFLSLAKKVITEEKKPLSSRQIWEISILKGYTKDLGIVGKTPKETLSAMLYVDVRDNKNSDFLSVGENPKRFYLKSLGLPPPDDIVIPLIEPQKYKYFEKDLHPFLAYFGHYYLHIQVKTINHTKSKKEFGEWVHPDMVGCYFPFASWESEVAEISSTLGNSAIKLYSFELKLELGYSNLRESFFQAVSNSSWSNEGYLVASVIDDDSDFREELKRLSTAFGIGVIRLDTKDPDSSEIIFPAQMRENVDWETLNKLSRMNEDFKTFLKRIKNDIAGKEIRRELYDKILDKVNLIKSINNE